MGRQYVVAEVFMFMTCHLCCCNIWLETFVTSPTTQIKHNNHIIIHRDGLFHYQCSKILVTFEKQNYKIRAKRKNQRKLNKLPRTNSVFISQKNIYVFYIYLFIALGIFQKHKFVNFWKDCYAWLGSDIGGSLYWGNSQSNQNGLKYFVGKVGEFRENLITTLIIKIEDFIFVYFVYQVLSLL